MTGYARIESPRHRDVAEPMTLFALALIVTSQLAGGEPAARIAPAWPQLGGPQRSFSVDGVELAEAWDERPPRELWRRSLSGGHSGIVVDGETAYTLAGGGKRETVIALDAVTGAERWRYSYDVSYASHMATYDGPHATPLLLDERLITVSIDAKVQALDRATGTLLWRRDLVADHAVEIPQSGYAASPIAWRRLILLPGLGGSGPAALALDPATGETVWARHEFLSSHASPILIEVEGLPHVVFHGMDWIYGLDPATGDVRWKLRLRRGAFDNVSFTPLWDEERRQLVVSHRYDDVGARALQLVGDHEEMGLEPKWTNRRLQVEHGNGVLLDAVLYGSHRGQPAFLAALDLEEGRLLWSIRLPKATLLAVGDKLLILDEEGALLLTRPSRRGLEVLARHQALQYNAWTTPSLVGKTLFLRDRFEAVALQLP